MHEEPAQSWKIRHQSRDCSQGVGTHVEGFEACERRQSREHRVGEAAVLEREAFQIRQASQRGQRGEPFRLYGEVGGHQRERTESGRVGGIESREVADLVGVDRERRQRRDVCRREHGVGRHAERFPHGGREVGVEEDEIRDRSAAHDHVTGEVSTHVEDASLHGCLACVAAVCSQHERASAGLHQRRGAGDRGADGGGAGSRRQRRSLAGENKTASLRSRLNAPAARLERGRCDPDNTKHRYGAGCPLKNGGIRAGAGPCHVHFRNRVKPAGGARGPPGAVAAKSGTGGDIVVGRDPVRIPIQGRQQPSAFELLNLQPKAAIPAGGFPPSGTAIAIAS